MSLHQTLREPCLGACLYMRLLRRSCLLPDLAGSFRKVTARRRSGTSSPTSPARSPGDSRTRSAQWEVAKDGENHVLYQKAKNEDATFNVALVEGTSYKDVDLSVKLRAVAGEIDRGGGVVWRAKDKKNYYIARYNPLEDNFRVYKVAGRASGPSSRRPRPPATRSGTSSA